MDKDKAREFFKKYSPITICFIGAMILVTIGERNRGALLVVIGFVMQILWSWRLHRKQ